MSREYAIDRLLRDGYSIEHLGKNIKATKKSKSYIGKTSKVYLNIFGYR